MAGSLKMLLRHTKASAGGASNDHDPIARVRPVDVYAVAKRIAELEAIVTKLPKTEDGVPVVPGMKLYAAYNNGRVCSGFETRDGRLTCLHYVDGFDRCTWAVYSTREAAEAAKEKS